MNPARTIAFMSIPSDPASMTLVWGGFGIASGWPCSASGAPLSPATEYPQARRAPERCHTSCLMIPALIPNLPRLVTIHGPPRPGRPSVRAAFHDALADFELASLSTSDFSPAQGPPQ